MKNKELTKEEIDKRRNITKDFLDSIFYRTYFEPYIKSRVEKESNISNIKEESDLIIVRSYIKQKSKRDLYRSLLTKFKEWAEKEYKL